MRIAAAAPALVLALLLSGCGYRRLDARPRSAAWQVRGETVRIAAFKNRTSRLGVEETFRKALENRIVAASPWRLVGPSANARWVLQGAIETYEVRALSVQLGGDLARAGSASRVEVVVSASVQLLDGVTGDVVISRPQLTFSNQYRVDQNFASFNNQELRVLTTLADDFAESFLTQLLEGGD